MSDVGDTKRSTDANKGSPDEGKGPGAEEQARLNDLVGADDYEAGAEEVQKDVEHRAQKPSAPKPAS